MPVTARTVWAQPGGASSTPSKRKSSQYFFFIRNGIGWEKQKSWSTKKPEPWQCARRVPATRVGSKPFTATTEGVGIHIKFADFDLTRPCLAKSAKQSVEILAGTSTKTTDFAISLSPNNALETGTLFY
jgi:hypothetical protein